MTRNDREKARERQHAEQETDAKPEREITGQDANGSAPGLPDQPERPAAQRPVRRFNRRNRRDDSPSGLTRSDWIALLAWLTALILGLLPYIA